jgi:hypothetical protein
MVTAIVIEGQFNHTRTAFIDQISPMSLIYQRPIFRTLSRSTVGG